MFSTVGVFSTMGGYHDACGGDIMSTMEGVQYHGGIPSFEI